MALALIVVASLAATSCAGDKPSGSGVATPPEATAQASTTATQQPRMTALLATGPRRAGSNTGLLERSSEFLDPGIRAQAAQIEDWISTPIG